MKKETLYLWDKITVQIAATPRVDYSARGEWAFVAFRQPIIGTSFRVCSPLYDDIDVNSMSKADPLLLVGIKRINSTSQAYRLSISNLPTFLRLHLRYRYHEVYRRRIILNVRCPLVCSWCKFVTSTTYDIQNQYMFNIQTQRLCPCMYISTALFIS